MQNDSVQLLLLIFFFKKRKTDLGCKTFFGIACLSLVLQFERLNLDKMWRVSHELNMPSIRTRSGRETPTDLVTSSCIFFFVHLHKTFSEKNILLLQTSPLFYVVVTATHSVLLPRIVSILR
jgi:hypothetical protein